MSDDLGTPHLRFERRGPIAWCTIDRPEARNALTASMYFGLRKAVDLVNGDPKLGALVITGTGDVFAPGGEMGGRHDEGTVNVAALLGMDVLPFTTLRNSAAPIVSAVNGLCQGGGLMTALLSDVAVASERATFRAPELLRGVADSWYAAVLPAHVGIARARELVLTARRIDAAEAERPQDRADRSGPLEANRKQSVRLDRRAHPRGFDPRPRMCRRLQIVRGEAATFLGAEPGLATAPER